MNEQGKRAVDSVVCFGSCQLDVRNVQLWRDHHEVKLTGKAFAVLCYFVQHPGQLVTKDDLFAAAWPETVVSDATLASCIQEIRQALGDEAKKPRYIETMHRRGFRFIVKSEEWRSMNDECRMMNEKWRIDRRLKAEGWKGEQRKGEKGKWGKGEQGCRRK